MNIRQYLYTSNLAWRKLIRVTLQQTITLFLPLFLHVCMLQHSRKISYMPCTFRNHSGPDVLHFSCSMHSKHALTMDASGAFSQNLDGSLPILMAQIKITCINIFMQIFYVLKTVVLVFSFKYGPHCLW